MTTWIKYHIKIITFHLTYLFYKLKYKNPLNGNKNIYIHPKNVKYFITKNPKKYILPVPFKSYFTLLGTVIVDNDIWKTKKSAEKIIKNSWKYRSIKAHFIDNVPWIETEMFIGPTKNYKDLFSKFDTIKGCNNLEELADHYDTYYDSMFQDIKQNGLQIPSSSNKIDPLFVDIDENGNFCYTRGGNHRLAMALVLELDLIPVFIRAIHKEWQKKRDLLWEIGEKNFFKKYPKLKNHPGLL